jgi:hypothetical protein
MLRYADVISAQVVLSAMGGLARHQLDFSGTSGTVTIGLNAGAGNRIVETIDLSNTARLPYSVECEAVEFTIVPSVSTTVSYCANRVS